MNEAVLFNAYRQRDMTPTATRPCACGATITARLRDESSISMAVAAHNESTAHRRWRERNGL